MKYLLCCVLLAAGAVLPAHAQPATPAQKAAGTTAADTVQQHLLHETADLATVRAEELPDLFEHFITTVRDERRGWTYRHWSAADQVLSRLVARYQLVHSQLPFEERVRIRAVQTEFKTLKSTRKASE